MDSRKIMSVLIAVIMLSSTLGFALWSASNAQQDNSGDNSNLPPEQVPTAINFKAGNVSATIAELLPQIRVAGVTKELDITKIDSSIYEVSGVRAVGSAFAGLSQGDQGLTYIATISFESDKNAAYIIESIEKEGIVTGLDGYHYAIVELPKKIVFQSENQDLNISKEYEFNDSLSNAMVGLPSIKGDEIKADVSATFLGSQITNLSSIETENITAAPLSGETVLELSISSLGQSIFFTAKAFYSTAPDANFLKKKILKIADVNGAELDVPAIAPKLFLSGENVISEERLHDLNVFVQSLPIQRVSFYNEQGFSAAINFDADKNLLDARQKLEEELSRISLPGIVVEENSLEVSGNISLVQPDSKAVVENLESAFLENNLQEISLKQPAMLSIEKIFDAETNTEYAVDENVLPAAIKTGHSIGEKINAKITYYVVRGKIEYIFGEEQ